MFLLRLRIGTFNVNGKLPSQDLAAWVQSQVKGRSGVENTTLIPPLPEVSPLKVEDPTSSPLETAVSNLTVADKNDQGATNEKGSVTSSPPLDSVNSDVTLVHDNAENTAQEDPNIPLDHDHLHGVENTANISEEDSDLIVLGFQELDLSAGALLYSTETTREDAWFAAVMAGMGEKAEHYEKVRSSIFIIPRTSYDNIRRHAFSLCPSS